MILYVHAGTHKTGSTAIQAFLWRHRDLLDAHGLYIPRSGAVGTAPEMAHHNIAWETGSFMTHPEAGGVKELLAELRARDPERACISSEVFVTYYAMPDALARLAARLKETGVDVRVLLSFRPQASYLEGLYAELVKHGWAGTFEDYFEIVLRNGAISYNDATYGFEYDVMADAFAAVFGREKLAIVPYLDSDRAEETIERFLAVVAPATADWDLAELGAGERINLSIGFRGVAERLVTNRADESRVASVLGELIPRGAVRADGPFRPLGVADLARLLKRFGPNNRVLRRRYGVDVPVFFAKRLIEQVRS